MTESEQGKNPAKHSSEHPMERPYIVEEDGMRMLQFDDWSVQSCMQIDDPTALVYAYTRIMMGFLLFHPEPRNILLVGLGGGSLAKFCYHRLANCRVTSVEISAAVIALRNQFAIPADDDRFRIVHADAYDYLQDVTEIADVILLDGFEPSGLPARLCGQTFYENCYRALRPEGVLVCNLWGGWIRLRRCYTRLQRYFRQQMLCVKDCETGENQIVFGLKHVALPPWQNLGLRVLDLQRKTQLDFLPLLMQFRQSECCQSGTFEPVSNNLIPRR